MKRKRIGSMLTAAALCLSLLPGAAFAAESMDNFKAGRTYADGQFTDVSPGSWYAGSYAAFPGVPDFGALLGIDALADLTDPADGSGGYFYASTDISQAGHMSDFADLYVNALIDGGFYMLGEFENSDGGITLIFDNGVYSVMFGVAMASGIPGIMIAIVPA